MKGSDLFNLMYQLSTLEPDSETLVITIKPLFSNRVNPLYDRVESVQSWQLSSSLEL